MFMLRLIPGFTGHRSVCFCNGLIIASQCILWLMVIMTIESYYSQDITYKWFWVGVPGILSICCFVFFCKLLFVLDNACQQCKKL